MVLVTGGLGYLGGRICEFLVNSGKKVRIGTSRLGVSIPEQLNECEIVKIDLLDPQSLDAACRGVTSIIHLAALNVKASSLDPKQALMINGMGTLNLLSSAIRNKVEKFLYFSTVHIYSSQLHGEINEDTLTRPAHHYSITHKLAEDYVLDAGRKKLLTSTVLRLSNAVGRPLTKDVNCWMLVVNDLCRQAIVNKKIVIHSGKYSQRDFLPISSICEAVYFILKEESLNNEVVNLSSGSALTLHTLANFISDRVEVLLGFKPTIYFNHAINEKKGELLSISNKKLKKAGFTIDADLFQEVDQLLLNCKLWFSEVNHDKSKI